MKDLFLVASYTFKDLVKRKSFIISNIIILIMVVIGFNVPNIIKLFKGENDNFGETKIAIVDKENLLEGSLNSLKQGEKELGYTIEIPEESVTIDQIKEQIKQEEIDSALVIEKTENGININYLIKSMGMTSMEPENLITAIKESYKNVQISKLNVSEEQMLKINMPFTVAMSQVDENEAQGNLLAMMLLSIVLFYAIYFYAYQVSTSITTEKTSKIIETLVTSTSPRTIVIGKTIGIGVAGLLQTAVTVIVAIICANAFLTKEMIDAVLNVSNFTPTLAISTIAYYILGYSLFALLYALTGSTVAKPEDIQSANSPVAILAVVGFYLSYFTMMNPASELNAFASMFPISSPFCMPFRIMMGLADTKDILISLEILIITMLVVAKVSIKIYSSAILNNGSKISIKDMVRIYKNKND